MRNKAIAYLKISSFRGISLGATHWYGEIVCGDIKEDLTCQLTARQAAQLNKKDGGGWHMWKKGASYRGFDSLDDVIEAGLKIWKTLCPDALILVKGSPSVAEPQPVLAGPDNIKTQINTLHQRAESLGWWDGGHYKEVDRICKQWEKIVDDLTIGTKQERY